jgi:hypothetical protein
MRDLQQLIRLYLINKIDFTSFRAQFVTGFLASSSSDSAVEGIVMAVEAACDDFSEGIIPEASLRTKFVSALPAVSSQVIFTNAVTDAGDQQPRTRAAGVGSVTVNCDSNFTNLHFATA